MTEPGVALTDYLLALEAALLCGLIWRGRPLGPLRVWGAALYASLSLASLAGGTTHGFFLDSASLGHAILWPLTLISIGITALCLWVIGARLGLPHRQAGVVTTLATIVYVLYAIVVLFVTSQFLIAIVAYLPAVLFLLAMFYVAWRRTRVPIVLVGAAAVVITIIASIVQRIDISLLGIAHANNVLYHALEAIALLLLYPAISWISSRLSLPV